jgi:hypothetical protein
VQQVPESSPDLLLHNSAQSGDAFNFDMGVLRTVTMLLAEAFAALHLKGDHFFALHCGIQNFGLYRGRHGASGFQVTITVNQQYFVQFQLIASITFKVGNVQALAFGNLKLLTSYFYHSEHVLSKFWDAKVAFLY